ncbi:MAG: 1,4-dihydroxy-6-naphthoate synthase [Candidatus Magnetoovum sp. WYHC-5]|nr:1,4-dihydroxy-6-naphthoate synthase [Candidatus Magnetoovum sp. WYHC-5]
MASGMSRQLSLGFSPCPNDTYIFYAMAQRIVSDSALGFSTCIDDVEALNNMAIKGTLDITKLSFHAYAYVAREYELLESGSALGRGCGPLLIARKGAYLKSLKHARVAIPGKYTTAFFLLQLYEALEHPFDFTSSAVMPFHQIMAAVSNGTVDCGIIIHEGRFTYPLYGLIEIIDLGAWWERLTGRLIPLGGIFAKKALGASIIEKTTALIIRSLQYAKYNKEETLRYVKQSAQELSDEVIMQHIALYVNNYTERLDAEATAAIETFLHMGYKHGIFK